VVWEREGPGRHILVGISNPLGCDFLGQRWIMKTYVAEINGEAILAYRAEDDEAARQIIGDEERRFKRVVRGKSGLVRADGRVLWDGASPIRYRSATPQEHWLWVTLRSSLKGPADDPNDWVVYLVPVVSVLEDDAKS
jgi:hypothetical protein